MIDRMTNDQLDALTTHRLLNVYRKERQCMFFNDYYATCSSGCFEDPSEECVQESKEHQEYLDEMKSILDTREHIARKK